MSASALGLFALALAVTAGSPGPSVAALVSRIVARGFRDVLPFLAAMWLGEVLWLTLAVAGLAVVAQRFGPLFTVLRFAGVGYLLLLAWRMWHAPTDLAGADVPAARSGWRLFGAGLLVTLGNPKIMVFYVALLPTIVDLPRVDVFGWLALTATALLVVAAVDLAWSLLALRARRLLKSRRAVRTANRLSASTMAGAAVAIAAR